MQRIIAVALLAILTGCASSGSQSGNSLAPEPPPISQEQAKQLALSARGRIWKDPDSIRDASIGQPYKCAGGLAHIADPPNACVCVEANARNSFGGYTGLKRNELLMRDGNLVDVLPAREATYSCGAMTPFPELNGRR